MQEEVVPGFAANGVTGFGDGIANAEVEMNLKMQASIFDSTFTLLTIVSVYLVHTWHVTASHATVPLHFCEITAECCGIQRILL